MNGNGLTEGRDYVLDVRWAEGDYSRFAALAFELLERKSSVIIVTTIAAARAAQQVAPATPLVMTGLIDPIGVYAPSSCAWGCAGSSSARSVPRPPSRHCADRTHSSRV